MRGNGVWHCDSAFQSGRGRIRNPRGLTVTSSLDVVHAKIERAEAHLADLEREIEAFFGNDPHEIPGEYDQATKRFTFRFTTQGSPPPILDILVGEAAHALRSALNNLVSALSGGSYGDTDFPIFLREADFYKTGARRIRRLAPEVRAVIESLQPYHQSDPTQAALAILSRIARDDKHRAATFKVSAYVAGAYEFTAYRDIASYGEAHLFCWPDG